MALARSMALGLLLGSSLPAEFVAPVFAQTCECPPGYAAGAGPVIYADEPPPPLPEYDQPPMPAPGYYWTPGYWAWNNVDYYWSPGVWVEPPRPGLLWTPGYWAFVNGAYLFNRGYWGPTVGFYGGVNYGFGYAGQGYEGGRWENQHFFYNKTVNNFGALHVTNVYAQPISLPPNVNRVSFNGPGGVMAKPTPEQLRAATEQHVPLTPAQAATLRAASVAPDQFRSENHGKPPVAATPRPGRLRGPGAVPARAAGSAEVVPPPAQSEQPAPNEKRPQAEKPSAAPSLPASGVKPAEPQRTAPTATPTLPAEEKRPEASKSNEKPRGNEPPARTERPPAVAEPGRQHGGQPKEGPKLRAEEKRPEAPKPNEKTPGKELPRTERPPAAAEPRQPPRSQPKEAPRAPAEQKRPEAPKPSGKPPGTEPPRMERPPAATTPERPPPHPEAGPNGGRPPAAEERRPQKPTGGRPECGKPGEPPCPK